MVWYYRRKRRRIAIFLVFPLLIISSISYVLFQLSHSFVRISEDKIHNLTFSMINEIVENEMEKIDTSNLIEYKFDSNEKIVAVNANVSIMNKLNNGISEQLSNKMSNLEHIFIKLPLGSFVSGNFFSGVGPEIPVEIVLLNRVNTEYHTDFTSTGINQSRHRIIINVTCDIGILSQLSNQKHTVNVEVPIAETIIIGNVPTTYLEFK